MARLKLTDDRLYSIYCGSDPEYELIEILPEVDDGYLGSTPFVFKDREGRYYKEFRTYNEFGEPVFESLHYGDGYVDEVVLKKKTTKVYEFKNDDK